MMASIFGLPTELLHGILLKLERECLKEFRRVCRESCARVTPILFNRVYFDFDPSGTDGLVNISRQPLLATHVKSIEWQEATIYEYEPFLPHDSHESHDKVEVLEGIMSASEWHCMTDDSRRTLFDDYQEDYDAITRQTSQLASAMSSAIQHGQGYISELQNVTEAHQTIREFNAAVERLRNITNFRHCPTYHYDEWGERWRQIQFHRDALIFLKKVPTWIVCAHVSLYMYPHFPRRPPLRLQGCEADRFHLYTPRLYAYSPLFSPDGPSSFVGKREAFLDRIHRGLPDDWCKST
jgi:hypothetical protein